MPLPYKQTQENRENNDTAKYYQEAKQEAETELKCSGDCRLSKNTAPLPQNEGAVFV